MDHRKSLAPSPSANRAPTSPENPSKPSIFPPLPLGGSVNVTQNGPERASYIQAAALKSGKADGVKTPMSSTKRLVSLKPAAESTHSLSPKPPSTPKSSIDTYDGDNVNQQESSAGNVTAPAVVVELPPRLAQMTAEERKTWTLRDADADQCIEEMESMADKLISCFPSLLENTDEYAPLFGFIVSATASTTCSPITKDRAVKALVDKGWIEFLIKQMQQIFNQVDILQDGCENTLLDSHARMLLLSFEAIGQAVTHCSKVISEQLFDNILDFVSTRLDHPDLLKAASEKSDDSLRLKMLTGLTYVLKDLMTVQTVRARLQYSNMMALESLLCRYIETLTFPDLKSTCEEILEYLEDNDSPMPRLPLAYLQTFKPTDDSLDKLIEDALYQVKRLAAVDLETHIAKPWRFSLDYSFMEMTALRSFYENCSPSAREKVYNSVVQDGAWYNLISNLYLKLLDIPVPSDNGCTEISPFQLEYAFMNVCSALLTVYSGTDICRDLQVQQQTFDHFADLFIDQLKNPRMLKAISDEDAKSSGDIFMSKIGDSMLNIIHNFTFYFESCIPALREKGMMAIARQIREITQKSEIKTLSLLIIAYLIDEGDDKKLMKITDSEVKYLIANLEELMQVSVHHYHADELIEGLNRIAVSDHNKLQVIEQGFLPLLVRSLDSVKYTPAQQAAAAKGIWNLAFNEKCHQMIVEQDGCMEALKKLKKSEHKEVMDAAAGALWQIEGKQRHIDHVGHTHTTAIAEKHIMLSYNHQAQGEVVKMKNALEKLGYKVWIDIEQITAGGSTLEAMSTAIEESCLVLIFFSEAYKNSVNCRAEAEYVFEQRKPFIPIQVQPKYTPNGWLGILMGSKYRYTLTKPARYDSEVSAILAKAQIMIGGTKPTTVDEPDTPYIRKEPVEPILTTVPSPMESTMKCVSWTPQQVSEWLVDSKLSPFKESLQEINGEMLAELVLLSQHHKDTFYALISKTPGANVADFLRFSCAAKRLCGG